jgi:UDPglucose 6-dehydrogenase
VTCIDVDREKVASLRSGGVPIYEPGLSELVERGMRAGRLAFTTSYDEGLADVEFVFIAVNTPPGMAGEADLTYVRMAAISIAQHLRSPAIVVNKSTMPIGTADWMREILTRHGSITRAVVSNPEFLREGSAIADFQSPDRIVLGSDDHEAVEEVARLYAPLKSPVLLTDPRTAEMIKYASNAFLATKISFINEIAAMCDKLGANVEHVANGMGLDSRIGRAFLNAGIGYGGSCFPKDVQALAHMAALSGCHPQLLRAVMEINRDARRGMVVRLRSELGRLEGRTVGVLGLAFKPDTDDLREAPAVEIIHLLLSEGAVVKAYDPAAMAHAERLLKGVQLCQDPYQVADDADALLIVTEWSEFKQLDFESIRSRMARPLVIDGRNLYDHVSMSGLGIQYVSVGRTAARSDLVDGVRFADAAVLVSAHR